MQSEYNIIRKIEKIVKSNAGKKSIKGIGDDCAVLPWHRQKYLLVSTDTLNENVHFKRQYLSFYELGIKSATAGISDIYAMGGRCMGLVVSISIPKNISSEDIRLFYRGIKYSADYAGSAVIGGDTTSSKHCFSVTVTAIGTVKRNALKRRSGARAGDRIYITGQTGYSLAGLEMLKRGIRKKTVSINRALKKHKRPLVYKKRIPGLQLITSMIDVSDGLSSELHHLAGGSGKRICIAREKLLTDSGIIKLSAMLKAEPLDLVLSSGEEYELLFTARPGFKRGNLLEIGYVEKGKPGVFLQDAHQCIPLKPSGFSHFFKD
jgi:thiamine-monophosphate kinase